MSKINLILISILILLLTACEKTFNVGCIKPEGSIETRTIDYDDFTDLSFNFPCEVFVTQGEEYELIIEATPNIIDRIEADSRKVGSSLDFEINGCARFDDNDVIFRITMPSLEELKIKGSATVSSTNTIETGKDLKLFIEGLGNIALDVNNIVMLSTEIMGSGEIELSGTCNELELILDGLGKIDASNLTSVKANVDMDGASDVLLHVTEEVIISISGLGEITTTGTALTQEIYVEGGADVKNFGLEAEDTKVELEGMGDVEITCLSTLSVKIEGAGDVCYRGTPSIEELQIEGLGSLNDCN